MKRKESSFQLLLTYAIGSVSFEIEKWTLFI